MAGEYKYKSVENRRKAKFLLDKLMPEAERMVGGLKTAEAHGNDVGDNAMSHAHISRVTGVHVYQGRKGGWFFDLSFKDFPPGVPNIMGQPVGMPLPSRDEAVQGAVTMLAWLIKQKDRPLPSTEDAVAVFPFDHVIIQVPSSLIARIKAIPVPSGGPDYVKTRLDEVREEFAGDGPMTVEVMNSLTEEQQLRVMTVVTMAMAEGFVRWPEYEEEAPAKSKPSGQSRRGYDPQQVWSASGTVH